MKTSDYEAAAAQQVIRETPRQHFYQDFIELIGHPAQFRYKESSGGRWKKGYTSNRYSPLDFTTGHDTALSGHYFDWKFVEAK